MSYDAKLPKVLTLLGEKETGCSSEAVPEMPQSLLEQRESAWQIYSLIDPRDSLVKYVGVSNRSVRERLLQHLSETRRGKVTPKHLWIKDLLDCELEPMVSILESGIGSCWVDREKHWIRYFRELGNDLKNVTTGGQGSPGFRPSKESNEKRSKSHKGRKFTDEHKKKLSDAKIGRRPSEEAIRKTSEKLRGRKRPDDVIRKVVATRMANGYTHSKETRDKISMANKNRSPEVIAKMVQSTNEYRKERNFKELSPLIDKAKKLIEKEGLTLKDVGRVKMARLLGVDEAKARRVVQAMRNGSTLLGESQEIAGDRWNISIPSTRIHTLEQLVEFFKIDLTQWVVERFVANRWEVGVGDGLGNIIVEPLFQVKANLVRAKGMTVAAVKEEIASLKSRAKADIKATPIKFSKTVKNGNCLELSLYDAHLGRLSWGEETLWENYDLNIASIEYDRAMDELLSRTSLDVEEIVYVIGNDLIHFDNLTNTTTRGTPQDADGRFHKVFKRTREVVQRQIEKIRQIAPVKLYIVPGNHDTLSTWHLGDSLECYYHNVKNVTVLNDPAPRKYYTWGENMIMYCHGDNGKMKDYPLLMATEKPDMWAASRHREIHCGHFHQEKVQEIMGCKVRIIPALCPPDNWHSKSGYVGNIRAAQGFVWNKKEGLIGTAEYSILNPAE